MNRRGLSLIELTITIAITSVLIYGITTSVRGFIRSVEHVRNTYVAMNLARLKMVEVRAGTYPGTGTTTLASEASFPGYAMQRVVTNVASSGGRSVRRVQINVANSTAGFSTPLVRLESYVTSVASFGDGV